MQIWHPQQRQPHSLACSSAAWHRGSRADVATAVGGIAVRRTQQGIKLAAGCAPSQEPDVAHRLCSGAVCAVVVDCLPAASPGTSHSSCSSVLVAHAHQRCSLRSSPSPLTPSAHGPPPLLRSTRCCIRFHWSRTALTQRCIFPAGPACHCSDAARRCTR